RRTHASRPSHAKLASHMYTTLRPALSILLPSSYLSSSAPGASRRKNPVNDHEGATGGAPRVQAATPPPATWRLPLPLHDERVFCKPRIGSDDPCPHRRADGCGARMVTVKPPARRSHR